MRGLAAKIEIVPNPRGHGGVDLRLHGELSRLMRPREEEQMPASLGAGP